MHQSMNALGVVNMVAPEHVVLRHIHSGVAFVTAVHAREFDRISNEEDRKVIKDKVMVAIFSEKFGRPSFDVSEGISLEPFSPPTVEMRVRMGVFLPTPDKNFASVVSEISSSISKVPLALAALACTLLSLYVSISI